MKLTDVCIDRPVLAWMLMAGTIVFGLVAFHRIGISQFPDVDYPMISVSMTYEGAAPEVMEHDVLQPVEEAMAQVEGVRSVRSGAAQGSSWVTVELDLSRDVDSALQDVQSRIARIGRRLPRDMDPPVVSKSNPEDQPIMWVSVSGPFAPQMLADMARYRVADKLQTVPGVGEISLGGYLERNIRIWINNDSLRARGLTVADVMTALRREHVELPAGRIEGAQTEVSVRVLGEAVNLEGMRRLVVRSGGITPVRLEDVALVEDGFEDRRRLARVGGAPAQGLGVRKQRGANAVLVARGVHAALAEVQKGLPEGMTAAAIFDSTRFIEESVHEIEFEIGLSILLTGLVCWLFLGSLSSTINVVLAIPMSLLGTVVVLYFCGFTLNTFTLLALGLAVGIVVDDAIMVLENIVRHAEAGASRRDAARRGTREIAFAALAASLAVVAIFAPVVFMRGVIGRFFMQFGIALTMAVVFSYVEAVTLAPARCAQLLNVSRTRASRLGAWVDRGFTSLAESYRRVLQRTLRHPGWVVTFGALVFGLSLFALHALSSEFVPSQDQSRLLVRLSTGVGSNLDKTDALVQQAEQVVHGESAIARDFTMVGGGDGVHTAFMFITMKPPSERQVTQQEMAGILRKKINGIPGLQAVVQDLSQAGFTAQRGFPINFSVRGPDWDTLVTEAMRLKQELQQTGAVVDLDTNYSVGMPELQITPNRARVADVGVSVEDVASTINALVGGVRVGKYNHEGRRIDVRMRLMADERHRPEDLARLFVRSSHGQLLPLTSLVRTEEAPTMQTINRIDRERAITIYANVAPGHSQSEVLDVLGRLTANMKTGYRAVLGGSSAGFQESMQDLYFALVLGIIVAYMVLASQFNSFLHPITVLTILPLSAAGAFVALWMCGKTLNIFSMIGILLLLGIVKKNSIVLVDYACHGGTPDETATDAMLRAGPVRLRPILMTSVATMMAVLPATLHLGPGAETRGPMGVAVMGGLLVSTVLSLLVVPAFYVLADRLKKQVSHWGHSNAVAANVD